MKTQGLLKQIIKNPNNKPACMPVSRAASLLFYAKISPAIDFAESTLGNKNKYYYSILEELFFELKFYYQQSKTSESADIRLERALKGLASTLNESSTIAIEKFLGSVVDEVECSWFMISSFIDYPSIKPDVFKDYLLNYIKDSIQLSNEVQNALINSKAMTLGNVLQDAFAHSTLASKLAILDILATRQEIDEQWLNSLEKSFEPILKAKIAILHNPGR
ncbi:MAG: hypothetical protein MJE63_05735 [Proteobacteria bacterium]|nr:hypothetical protein [Pseudomonadota bacterium]